MGPIKFGDAYLKIVDSAEMQRLRHIKQLGFCNVVFPEANHTRFSHSLGTFYLVDRLENIWRNVDLSREKMAALLHDIGHFPLSHTFESLFTDVTGVTHEEIAARIIEGRDGYDDSSIPIIIEEAGFSPKEVSELIKGSIGSHGNGTGALISGPLDMDEIDYLRRDAFFSGVSLGRIDYQRILNTVTYENGELLVQEKGLTSLESLAINRILMYRTVYFHKTVRIAQNMLLKALEKLDPETIRRFATMDDEEFLGSIMRYGLTQRAYRMIKRRRLYKVVGIFRYSPEFHRSVSESLEPVMEHSIIDIIPPLNFAGDDRVKGDQKVLTDGGIKLLSEISPLVSSLKESLEYRKIVISSDPSALDRVKSILSEYKESGLQNR